jgi:hypothetical protein
LRRQEELEKRQAEKELEEEKKFQEEEKRKEEELLKWKDFWARVRLSAKSLQIFHFLIILITEARRTATKAGRWLCERRRKIRGRAKEHR